VPINDTSFGSIATYVFTTHDWVAVNKQVVNSINMQLYNEYGQPINFRYGTVSIRLKLRRKRGGL
jgi:hypothetical protein